MEAVVGGDDVRDFGETGSAPCGPEVEEDDLSFVVAGEGDGFAVCEGGGEGWSGAAGAEVGAGGFFCFGGFGGGEAELAVGGEIGDGEPLIAELERAEGCVDLAAAACAGAVEVEMFFQKDFRRLFFPA